MDTKIVNKKWGYEIWLENSKDYCGKHLHVLPSKWSSVHYHREKRETYYIISGELLVEYSTDLNENRWKSGFVGNKILKKGEAFTIERMVAHRFTSNLVTPCDFVEISTYHDDNDCYRIIESI